MLTRYEEIVKKERDEYDRFPARASLAFQEDFLERPIINEYIEILWWAIQKLWSGLKRKQRQFRIIPTHDVDQPFAFLFLSPYQIMKTLAGDILKRHSISTFIRKAKNIYKVKVKKNILSDENYTFNLIMDISEKCNIVSTFYMMLTQGLSNKDGNYSIRDSHIINLMKSIHARGHKIGLHPSFVSYLNGEEIKQEVQQLRFIGEKIGIDLSQFGARQHYLRWQGPDTWQHYEDAGLIYDTTLSYADHIGFRCGTCYEYTVFNLNTRKHLTLTEQPLIVMDCTALDTRYMNLHFREALDKITRLKETCKKYNGNFVILWHNDRFVNKIELDLYSNLTLVE
jgi:hypothetical protein